MSALRSLHESPLYRRAAAAALLFISLILTACPSEEWIAVNGSQKAAVTRGYVVYLDNPPSRPHEVIGIITPPAGEYETEAEAVKDMLKVAAKYGADAIYIESKSESGGWQWSGASGGSFSDLNFRAKAIVWK